MQQENTEYPAMRDSTKQLKEKLRKDTRAEHQTAVISDLAQINFHSQDKIQLKCSAFDCAFSDYISHGDKLVHKKGTIQGLMEMCSQCR